MRPKNEEEYVTKFVGITKKQQEWLRNHRSVNFSAFCREKLSELIKEKEIQEINGMIEIINKNRNEDGELADVDRIVVEGLEERLQMIKDR